MTESNGDHYHAETTKPVNHLAILALGFGPIGLAAGLVLLLYRYAGSWERVLDWLMAALNWVSAALVAALLLFLVSLVAYAIGRKIWYGDLETHREGQGGLSAVRIRRREARTARIAAREAALRQDGQVSMAEDAIGRVSVVKR